MIGVAWLARVRARLPDALRAVAEQVLETARADVPVRTGHLRDSLRVEKADDYAVRIVSDAPQALAVETRQPFLRPALLSAREALSTTVREVLR